MKLVCTDDQTTSGLVFKKTVKEDGLTVGKTYDAMLFSDASGMDFTSTEAEFLIYNDLGKWATYDVDRFKPANG